MVGMMIINYKIFNDNIDRIPGCRLFNEEIPTNEQQSKNKICGLSYDGHCVIFNRCVNKNNKKRNQTNFKDDLMSNCNV